MISFRRCCVRVTKLREKYYRSYGSVQVKEEKIKIDKWDINYIKVGNGSHHVLCLPGALGTIWTDFRPQIEGFDKDKFTLVVWDPPGYGKSRPPDKDFKPDIYEKDADYAYEFMKAQNITRYSVMGWSGGGMSGFIHAAKYPEATMKLVGISTIASLAQEQLEYAKQIRDLSAWSETMKKTMSDVYGDELAQYWSRWVDGMENIFNAGNGNICKHLLGDIKCPTFLLFGKKDLMIPHEYAVDVIKHVAGARSHTYPDGKHNIHLKYYEDFNERVQNFLLQP